MLRDRPIALSIVAAGMLFTGIDGALAMLVAFFAGDLSFQLSFLFLPAALGLLRLSERWRRRALVLCWVSLTFLAVILGRCAGYLAFLPSSWFDSGVTVLWSYPFLKIIVRDGLFLAFFIYVLTRSEIKTLFHEKPSTAREPTPGSVTPHADA